MGRLTAQLRRLAAAPPPVDSATILGALTIPVLVVDEESRIRSVNGAAEQFFQSGASMLLGHLLVNLLPIDCPIMTLVESARATDTPVAEYGIELDTPRIGQRLVTVQAGPVPERAGYIVVSLTETSIARKLDQQLTHRHAARSVTAMAAMLAHEVKNPLSGIRGAAQLLEERATEAELELTRLICEETDRIVALVDRMDVFSDERPIARSPANIHEILERVRRLAQTGFARHVRFVEDYDPSLPMVLGNRDQLVQVFLNLVKNAAEAVPVNGGEIVLTTSFQPGIRFAVRGSDHGMRLPLMVTVEDNGAGIPEDLRAHLFDPFVTTKRHGTGLGLALVAKIIGDHGGMIEFDSQPHRTVFRVMLPITPIEEAE